MAQHDYIIANQSGAAFRADLNNSLAAIVSQNSGAAEPSTTYAYMPWADTANGLFKIRNAANSAWITLYQLDGEWSTLALEDGSATAPSLYFKDSGTDTGVYSPGTDQVGIATAGVQRVNFNAATEVVFNDGGNDVDFRVEGDTRPSLFKIDAGLDQVQVENLNGGAIAGTRNRIINGGMVIDQRNNGSSLSSGVNAVTYSVDRWYLYALGAAVTAQRVGSSAAIYQSAIRMTGAAGNSIMAFGQRIEATNSYDLANRSISLSFALATSNSISITWNLYYANAVDNFATPTPTLITSGTQATTQTLTNYTVPNILLPPQATAGLMLEFSVANFISGSIDITGVQLEPGPVATPFERRPFGTELALCQRYYYRPNISYAEQGYSPSTGAAIYTQIFFPVTMRVTPTLVASWSGGTNATASTISALGIYGAEARLINSSGGFDFAATINWTSFSAEL